MSLVSNHVALGHIFSRKVVESNAYKFVMSGWRLEFGFLHKSSDRMWISCKTIFKLLNQKKCRKCHDILEGGKSRHKPFDIIPSIILIYKDCQMLLVLVHLARALMKYFHPCLYIANATQWNVSRSLCSIWYFWISTMLLFRFIMHKFCSTSVIRKSVIDLYLWQLLVLQRSF